MKPERFYALAAILLVGFTQAAIASDTPQKTGALAIELNTTSDDENGCTLTFMVTNGHPVEIDKLVFETVLFDTAGQVTQLTLFDFGKLPASRPRVRQFALPQTTCDRVGRILFNGLHTCTADGLGADTCGAMQDPTSRTNIEVLG
ncbi:MULTISPECIES: hypothetical protein [Roseobacteraceae]|uniref:hypothetical protein n=1 Tax=Roseobacteraceae TaxID=2854170 RepID=UPI00329A4BDA